MGVAGSGKSTLLAALERRLGWPAEDGDHLHPASNIAKMAAGIPLDDGDRRPWLERIWAWIEARQRAREPGVIVASALKRAYRDQLRAGHPSVRFVELEAPRDVLEARLRARSDHFMPASLLDSQLAALQPLEPDEPGWSVDATRPPDELSRSIEERLRSGG
jgi:gluconokinase